MVSGHAQFYLGWLPAECATAATAAASAVSDGPVAGDNLHDQIGRITAGIWQARGAPGLHVPVAAGDAADLSAGSARLPGRASDLPVPVLAAPLVRNCLPRSAQVGWEMPVAPTSRKAMSRSAIARGPGDRPSASTLGLSSRAWAIGGAWPGRRSHFPAPLRSPRGPAWDRAWRPGPR